MSTRIIRLSAVLIPLFQASFSVFAADFFVPSSPHNPYQMLAPFLLWNTDVASFRYQQVYSAPGFVGLGSSQILINQLIFGTAGNSSPVPGNVLPNIRINFSTTSKVPDGLSTVFSENVGPNDTVVYSG